MGKGDYTVSDIYQGGYSSLKPSYGDVFTGYHASAGKMGLTTDPRTANVLQAASQHIATGIKNRKNLQTQKYQKILDIKHNNLQRRDKTIRKSNQKSQRKS